MLTRVIVSFDDFLSHLTIPPVCNLIVILELGWTMDRRAFD